MHPYKLHPYRVTFTERKRRNFISYYSYKFDEFELATVQQTAKLITCYLTSIFEITFELTGDDIYYVRNGEVQSRHQEYFQ